MIRNRVGCDLGQPTLELSHRLGQARPEPGNDLLLELPHVGHEGLDLVVGQAFGGFITSLPSLSLSLP